MAAYRDYAGDIHKSGTRLLTVINDVLDVSRLEGGLLTIEARPENVLDVGGRRHRAGARRHPATSARSTIDVPAGHAVAAWSIRAAWPRRWAIFWPMP